MDKKLLKNFITLLIPLVVQNIIISSVNLLDNIMVGQLGETALSGVSMANKVFFVYNLMMFGLSSGAIIFFAQYWGKRDCEGIKNVMSLTLTVAVATASIFFVISQLFTIPIMTILCGAQNAAMIECGAQYLRIMSVTFIFFALSFVIGTALKSIEKPRIALYGSLISLAANGFLNYVLIFGKFSAPRLGVQGAAIATLIARILEFTFILIASRRYKAIIYSPLRTAFKFPSGFVKRCMVTSLPVFFNETFWSIGITVYGAAFARMGERVAAAYSIVGTVENFLSSLIFGTSAAASIMIGKEIGSQNIPGAKKTAKFFFAASALIGFCTGIVMFVLAPFIVESFKLEDSARTICLSMLRILSLYMPAKSFVMTLIVGILRAGGDTRFCFAADLGALWILSVPMALIGAMVLKMDAVVLYAILLLEEPLKSIVALLRIKSGKWINDLVNK